MTAAQKTIARTAAAKKTSTAPKAKTAAKTITPTLAYAIVDYARPTAGRALAAHTAAFLALSGMTAGKPVASATAGKVLGARAVQYHTTNGNIEQTDAGLILTSKGQAFFSSRTVDAEQLKAYTTYMATGQISDTVNVKSDAQRVKL